MTENYINAKKKAFKSLLEMRKELARLKQKYNRCRGQRNIIETNNLKRIIREKKTELEFREELYRKTFDEN